MYEEIQEQKRKQKEEVGVFDTMFVQQIFFSVCERLAILPLILWFGVADLKCQLMTVCRNDWNVKEEQKLLRAITAQRRR